MSSLEREIAENAWDKLEVLLEEISLTSEQLAGRIFWQESENEPLFHGDPNECSYQNIKYASPFNQQEEAHYLFDSLEDLIDPIRRAINARNADLLESHIESFNESAMESKVDFSGYYDDLNECLEIIKSSDMKIIYQQPKPDIYIPELILCANDQLIKLIAKHPNQIDQISPRQFEEIIAEIFFKQGFEVELTKSTRDGGKDIVAISRHMGIPTKYVIECKKYARENKISIGMVQRLLGVKFGEQANKGILVTTSFFTKDAKAFASNHMWDLALKDYNDIIGWVKDY